MGQGKEELKSGSTEANVEILERGEIFFFYRPKVDKEEAHGPDDVQRLYIVLRPESGERSIEVKQDPHSGKEGSKNSTDSSGSKSEGGSGSQEVNIEKQPLLRLIVMGKKSLPDPTKKGPPYWGFIELVTTNIEDIKNALKGDEYDTATKGHRRNADARALGEGIYRIVKHHEEREKRGSKKPHAHLIYKLEFPREKKEEEEPKNEPQECLNIEREGSFLIQIKNPDQHGESRGQFRGLSSKRKAVFPANLQGQFGKLRYSMADPPDFLNYEGCELLLISASDDIEEELGLELKTEEGDSDSDGERGCSDLVNTFGETASTDPLFKGSWV